MIGSRVEAMLHRVKCAAEVGSPHELAQEFRALQEELRRELQSLSPQEEIYFKLKLGILAAELDSRQPEASPPLEPPKAVSAGAGVIAAATAHHPPAVRPPARAEGFLRWCLPVQLHDPVLGDLAEMHVGYCKEHGPGWAGTLYWWQAIRSVAPVLRGWLMQTSLLAAIGKAAAWLWSRFGS